MDEQYQEDQMFDPGMMPSGSSEDIWFRSETFRALEKILEDKDTSEKLKDFKLWAATSKSMKLTFFDEGDKVALENIFEAEVCKLMRTLPPNDITPELLMEIGQARMINMANIRRSYGTPVQKMNERIAIISQMKIQSNDGFNPPRRAGILGRMFGFGGR